MAEDIHRTTSEPRRLTGLNRWVLAGATALMVACLGAAIHGSQNPAVNATGTTITR